MHRVRGKAFVSSSDRDDGLLRIYGDSFDRVPEENRKLFSSDLSGDLSIGGRQQCCALVKLGFSRKRDCGRHLAAKLRFGCDGPEKRGPVLAMCQKQIRIHKLRPREWKRVIQNVILAFG